MGAVRLFLACGVVLHHFRDQVLWHIGLTADSHWALNLVGGRAVVFFYIVSGFLMSYVLHEKYPYTRDGIAAFYRARFLRIYPLWWILLALCLLIGMAPRLAERSPLDWWPSFALIGSDWILMFSTYPTLDWTIFPKGSEIGWTLGAELGFYLLAPWLLRSTKLSIAVFALSAALRTILYWRLGPHSPDYIIWSYFFFPATIMFFLLGHFAQSLSRLVPLRLWPSLALLAASGIMSYASPISEHWAPTFMTSACFALSLPGLFAATKDSRTLNFLGDLTYPLYLFHSLMIAALFWPWQIASGFGQALVRWTDFSNSTMIHGAALFAIVLSLCLGTAALIHVLIEGPARIFMAWLLDNVISIRRRSMGWQIALLRRG